MLTMKPILIVEERDRAALWARLIPQEIFAQIPRDALSGFTAAEKIPGTLLIFEIKQESDFKKLHEEMELWPGLEVMPLYSAQMLSSLHPELLEALKDFCASSERVYGSIDLDIDERLQVPTFRQLRFQIYLKSKLAQLHQDLDQTLRLNDLELMKVKKLHESLVPRRLFRHKGVSVHCKYGPGMGVGGSEYFDLFARGNQILLFLSSTTSYLASHLFLSRFSELQLLLQERKSIEINHEFISDFISKLENELLALVKQSEQEIRSEVFLGLIDLKELSFHSYNWGGTELVYDQSHTAFPPPNNYPVSAAFIDQAHSCQKLDRDSKLMILSPGLNANWQLGQMGKTPKDFLMGVSTKSSYDILHEMFFEMKKNTKDDSLTYDASLIIIEVGKNVIMQV